MVRRTTPISKIISVHFEEVYSHVATSKYELDIFKAMKLFGSISRSSEYQVNNFPSLKTWIPRLSLFIHMRKFYNLPIVTTLQTFNLSKAITP